MANMKKNGNTYFFCLLVLIVFVSDRITKIFVASKFQLNYSVPIINKIFHYTYIHNYGVGFGLLQNKQIIPITISFLVIGLMIYYYKRYSDKLLLIISLSLILGGTISNLVDRLQYGYVIDFIDFRIWPIFNIADSAITIGAIILGYYMLKEKKK